MRIIEPCCYHKQIGELIDLCSSGKGQLSAHFFSYSDWDAAALLDTLAGYAQGGLLTISMVRLDVSLIYAIRRVLAKTYVESSERAFVRPLVERIILVTQPGEDGAAINQRKEIRAQLGEYIDSGRITVCEDNIGFRCITAGGSTHTLVVHGSINAQRSNAMQMFTLTASTREYNEVVEMMEMKARTKSVFK